jgi:peroxiredoxin Q/BCP
MISVDDADTNKRFAEEHGADFPILSDPSKATANAYGTIPAGRAMASRWTFYIGPDGKIVFVDKAVKAADAGAGIVSKLTELGVKKR